MSKRMAPPQNKREDIIFTVMCVFFMCFCMLTYNMVMTMGFTWEAITQAWMLFPLTFVVCFCVDFFIACPIAKKIMSKLSGPWTKPWMGVVLTQFFTVCLVVILESFYGSLVSVGFTSQVWLNWLHHIPLNFIVAMPLMILVAGPLVTFLFRLLIPMGKLQA